MRRYPPLNTSNSTRLDSTAKKEVAQEIVYITRTGKRFHRASCRYLSKSMIPIERDKAFQNGRDIVSAEVTQFLGDHACAT